MVTQTPLSASVVALNGLAMVVSMTALYVVEKETKEQSSTAWRVFMVDGFNGLVAVSLLALVVEILLTVATTYIEKRAATQNLDIQMKSAVQTHECTKFYEFLAKGAPGGYTVKREDVLFVSPSCFANRVGLKDAVTDPAQIPAPSTCPSTSSELVPMSDESGTPTFVRDGKPEAHAAGEDALSLATTV
jgi:uncharacterized membrane protein